MECTQINNFFGHAAFIGKFGEEGPSGKKSIPARWQAGINNVSSAGQTIGLLINGWSQTRFGCRNT